jgi:hypothetical protein
LTALTPTFTLSAGATSSPASGTTENYSSPVTITVTAEDGTTVQEWEVTVTEKVGSTETDILTFSFAEQTDAAVIDASVHRVDVEVANGTVLTSLIPTYTLSPGATGAPVVSGVADDFSVERTIIVIAEDGTTEQEWKVLVTETPAAGSTHTDILSFSFPEQSGDADIDASTHTVDVVVVNGTVLTALTPTFTLSAGASSVPATGASGNYSSAVTITVTAEDGITIQAWTVNVTVAAAAGATTVVFGDGGTKATAITDIVVDGVTYDVEFEFNTPGPVYGPYPAIYTFTTSEDARTALDAVNTALDGANAESVGIVGTTKLYNIARIGYESFETTFYQFCRFEYTVFDPPWTKGLDYEDTPFNEKVMFAVFTAK